MTKKSLLYALVMFLAQAGFTSVFAIRATPFPIKITQPDGSQLTIRMRGDEHGHYQTTDDGYLVKQNARGYYVYGSVNASGVIVEDTVIAKNAVKRSASEIKHLKALNSNSNLQVKITQQKKSKFLAPGTTRRKAYPLNGSPKALVILVNFKDKAYVVPTPQASFQNLVTQPGYSANGGTGSAKDYFMASTYGKFAPDFVVVGPVTLPQTLDYYGKNDTDGSDTNPAQMIVDACSAANTVGVDFTQYDTDGDGFVDNVFVYYAGYNEAEGGAANTIWPHRWSVSSAGITTGITFDGKKIEDYSCTSELKSTSGFNMCGIGTFCHEFGHVLGLPDYYNTSGSSTYIATLETWDIMDYGPYLNDGNTPPTYSAWDRFYLGYLTPQQISSAANITLQPLYQGTTPPANTNGQAYLIAAGTHNMNATSPNPAEFFLVEYRKHTGWDAFIGQDVNTSAMPADGICIWHIDYLQSDWDNNSPNNANSSTQSASSHMRVYLQPLNGHTTTPGDAFTTGSYIPTTWSGTNLNRPISAITITPESATFKFMGGESVFGSFAASPATDVTSNSFTANWSAATGATKYLLNVFKKTASGSPATTVTEGFSTAPIIPVGWSSNATAVYASAGNFGAVSPSIKLDATGKYVKTPLFSDAITAASFWYKLNGTDVNSSLLIEGSTDGTTWTTIETMSGLATVGTTKTLVVDGAKNIRSIRVTYTKVAGNVAIDDASITYGQGVSQVNVLTDFEVLTGTSYGVIGLDNSSSYSYTVKAANATVSSSESNVIEVSLQTGIANSYVNKYTVRADKNSINLTTSTNETVKIFDAMGRVVREQAVEAGFTKIVLPSNQMYIVRIGAYSGKVVVR